MTIQIKEVNCTTGEEIVRDATTEEITQMEIDKAGYQALETARQANATQRQALLNRLGLTEEEARILLGGN